MAYFPRRLENSVGKIGEPFPWIPAGTLSSGKELPHAMATLPVLRLVVDVLKKKYGNEP